MILTKPSQTLEDGTVEPEKVYASAPSKLISKEELMEVKGITEKIVELLSTTTKA